MEGRRPLLAEVQALTTVSASERPRRTTSGLDGSRLAMIIAVLQQHCGIRLHQHDVFASTDGGARLADPAADLAVAVALSSATFVVPPPEGVIALGEIGLAGELRRVRDQPQRLAEAARLGFTMAVVPAVIPDRRGPRSERTDRQVDGMRIVEAPDVRSALRLLHVGSRNVHALEVVEPAGMS
jgi:DNA repair protein RadA/Sms